MFVPFPNKLRHSTFQNSIFLLWEPKLIVDQAFGFLSSNQVWNEQVRIAYYDWPNEFSAMVLQHFTISKPFSTRRKVSNIINQLLIFMFFDYYTISQFFYNDFKLAASILRIKHGASQKFKAPLRVILKQKKFLMSIFLI